MPAMATSQAGRSGGSRWPYILGIVMMFGSCSGYCGVSTWRMSARADAMQRFTMPGAHTLYLSPGHHVLYTHSDFVYDDTYDMSFWDGGRITCYLTEDTTHRRVPLPTISRPMRETYGIGSDRGHSLFDFKVEEAGTYVLECETEDSDRVLMGLSRGRVLGGMLYTMLGGFLVGGLGLAIIVVTRRKRQARPHG